MPTLGKRIKNLRGSMSQQEFADSLSITRQYVALLESDKRDPSPLLVDSLLQKYRVRRDWLLNGEEPMRLPPDEDDEIVDAVLAGEDEFIKAVIRGIAKTPGGWEKMREVFTAIDAELKKNTPNA